MVSFSLIGFKTQIYKPIKKRQIASSRQYIKEFDEGELTQINYIANRFGTNITPFKEDKLPKMPLHVLIMRIVYYTTD